MRFLLILLLGPALWCADATRILSGFDAIAERGLREMQIPGVAVGVLQDGKVLFAKGYGYRDLKTKQPVTPKTLFAMGSVTKSFTAAVVATVIDEGKLAWDKPVREYLPWFRLYDPAATELITVRDMLTHRSGLPRHDFIRFSTHLPRQELVRRLRYLEPNRTFRDVYQYNNLMYVTAGYLAGAMAGSTWEDLVRERLFAPVGMTRSNTSTLDSQKSDDFARPHENGREAEFYVYQKFGVGPNGAVNSCVEDMLKYLEMWLDSGMANGRRIISKVQMAELGKPVTVVNATSSYAPGWRVGSYRGHFQISHGGAITGFRAHAVLLPEKKAAIVAMINSEESLAEVLADTLADRVLELAPEDHLGKALERTRSNRSARAPAPSKWPAAYAGAYEHPAYGRIRVEMDGGELKARFDALSMGLGGARFLLDEKGQVREMHLPLEPAVKPFVFVRVAPSTP